MQHVCFMFGNTGNEKSAKVTTTMKLKEEFTVFGNARCVQSDEITYCVIQLQFVSFKYIVA